MPVTHRHTLTILSASTAALVVLALATPIASASAQSTPTKLSRKEAKAQAKVVKAEKKTEMEANGERVDAKDERKALMNQIGLTKAQKASVKDVQQRYDSLMKDVDTQLKVSEKGGAADPKLVARANALVARERTDLRALLSGDQVRQFDRNVAAITAKKR